MKIKVNATELHDADVEKVSLVKNGANRIPFRILKAEEISMVHPSLADQIAGAFSKKDDPVISAVVVRTGSPVDTALLEKADIDISNPVEVNDLTIYKQEGFDEDSALFALNDDVGVAVSGISKEFHPSMGTDFSENLKSQSFYPSLYNAADALMGTISSSMYKAGVPGDASTDIEKALSSFTKYVKGLVKSLPSTVFKIETLLRDDLGSSKVDDSTIEKSTKEDTPMSEAMIKEAAHGDLDGLLDEPVAKTEEPAAEVAKTDEVEAPEVVAKDGDTEDKPVEKNDTTDAAIVAELADKDGDGEQDPLKLIALALQTMTTELVGLKKTVETQNEKIDAVEALAKTAGDTATEAVEKADNSVVMTLNDIDESLSGMTRRRSVEKAEASEDVWAGVMPIFDSLNGGE